MRLSLALPLFLMIGCAQTQGDLVGDQAQHNTETNAPVALATKVDQKLASAALAKLVLKSVADGHGLWIDPIYESFEIDEDCFEHTLAQVRHAFTNDATGLASTLDGATVTSLGCGRLDGIDDDGGNYQRWYNLNCTTELTFDGKMWAAGDTGCDDELSDYP